VFRVSFLVLVCDSIRWTRPRVQIAKAAIAGDYVRDAFFYSAVLAVPVHVSLEAYYCAPRGITISPAGRRSEPCCRRKGSDTNRLFRKGFRHVDSSLDFLCLCKEHRNGKINPGPVIRAKARRVSYLAEFYLAAFLPVFS